VPRKGEKNSPETRKRISEAVKKAMWRPEVRERFLKVMRSLSRIEKIRRFHKIDSLRPERIKLSIQNLPKDLAREKNPRWIRPKLEPSSALAYVLGVLKGDGSAFFLKKRWGAIALEVITPEFNESFERALKEIGLNPKTRPYRKKEPNRKLTYKTIAFSTAFVEWYNSLTSEQIMNILSNDDFKREFIRGFYESEGGTYKKSRFSFEIKMACTNGETMKLVKSILNDLGFNFCLAPPTEAGPCYKLRVAGDEVFRFHTEIKPCIKSLPPLSL